MAVNTKVVLETIVERITELADERLGDELPEPIGALLTAELDPLCGCDDHTLEQDLRRAGYMGRVVEAELFAPARETPQWVSEELQKRFERTGSWPEAARELSFELARSEPLAKPSPDDESAASWRVSGPGGHVRHFVARRTIQFHLSRRGSKGGVGDPAELKRPWVYGFFVRTCEDALPAEASLE
jgi:hypothetical protein